MNVASHQEEKNEKTGKRHELADLKLRAAILRSFRGQHGKKMVCVKGVPGVTGTLEKSNSHFDPTQMGLGITPPR